MSVPRVGLVVAMMAGVAAGAPSWRARAVPAEQPAPDIALERGASILSRIERRAADPEAAARLDKLITDLNSDDAAVRAASDKALNDDAGITLPLIERALKDKGQTLPLDTRVRLMSAARSRFAETPRAAMGIQFLQKQWSIQRVVIEQTMCTRTPPEFDACGKILEGDMIIEADGVRLDPPGAQPRMQALIVSHDPGDVIPVVVRRGDQKVSLNIRLGRRDDLRNGGFTDTGMLERAWTVRSRSFALPKAETITTPVKAGEWGQQVPAAGRGNLSLARMKGIGGLPPAVVGGGMPRGAELNQDQIGQRIASGAIRRFPAGGGVQIFNGMVFVNGVDPFAEPTEPAKPAQEELDELVRARDQIAKVRSGVFRNSRVVPPGQAGQLEALGERELRMIDKVIASIRAEMTEAGLTPRETPAAPEQGPADKPAPTP